MRVPACYQAEMTDDGTLLVLEDLSAWQPGADPVAAARVLAGLHARCAGPGASSLALAATRRCRRRSGGGPVRQTWPAIAAQEGHDADRAGPGEPRGQRNRQRACPRPLRARSPWRMATHPWPTCGPAPRLRSRCWTGKTCRPHRASPTWPGCWCPRSSPPLDRGHRGLRHLGWAHGRPARCRSAGAARLADTPDGSAAASAWLARLEAAAVPHW